jgi:hypothetical protein
MVYKKIERPRDEWILVEVPPLVSPQLWQMANRILDKNAQMSRRNAKEPFLLTGVSRCGGCGNTYTGTRRKKVKDDCAVPAVLTRCYIHPPFFGRSVTKPTLGYNAIRQNTVFMI